MSPRPLSAADSAARRCGPIICSGRPHRGRRSPRASHTVAGGRVPARSGVAEHRAASRNRRGSRRPVQVAHPHRARSAMTPYNALARAIHIPRAAHVRDREPEDRPAGRRHGHARELVHAGSGRVGRHVRARVGDRRARGRTRPGPDRVTDPQRARRGPELGPSLLVSAYRRGVARGRGAVRLGTTGRGREAAGRESG